MKAVLSAFAIAAALSATDASAQGVNLTGQYRCVQLCADGLVGSPAAVNQIGWDMNLVNEAGQLAHAWIDRPGRLWIERLRYGADYSLDGMTIHFDNGTVWQRDFGQFEAAVPVQPPVTTRRRAVAPAPGRPAPRPSLRANAYDGSWSVLIMTQSGPCDRAYRYGVQINNGYVTSEAAGGANLQGRVAPNGAVQVSVSAMGNSAIGQGRLAPNVGTGTWHGQGPSGACAGTWQAERRG